MEQTFYIDTCIWLNLFKKEGDASKGVPYWQLAKSFIEMAMFSRTMKLAYSGIVLRELQLVLGEKLYREKRIFFEQDSAFIKVVVEEQDVVAARKLESEYNFAISFYDLLHITISRRLRLILITRDRQLLDIARQQGVVAKRPEDFL